MTDLNRFKLASIVTGSPFWVSTIIIYFNSKGINLPEVFKLISFYQISIVLLEYPTGVIGDYFSHKTSITIGYLIAALSLLISTIQMPIVFYYIFIFILAIGVTLVSGSNTALLHKLSTDFKKDSSSLKSISLIWSLIAISLGGVVGNYNINYPTYLSGTAFFIGFLIMLTIKYSEEKSKEGNIFSKAKEGIVTIKNNPILLSVLTVNAIISGIFLSAKWFYNPFFQQAQLNIYYWGFLISAATLSTILGVYTYKKTKGNRLLVNFLFLILLLFVTSLGMFGYTNLALVALFAAHAVGGGYIQTLLEVDINNHINDSTRASVLSFGSLLIGLFSSIYIYFIGIVLKHFNISYLFIFTGILLLLVGLPLTIKVKKHLNLSPAQP